MNTYYILAAGEDMVEVGTTDSSNDSEPILSTDTPADPNMGNNNNKPTGIDPMQIMIFALFGLFVYFIIFRGPKKKQQKHQQMVQTLKKNDRVRTIGGLIGTVVDIKDDEITLKIDESNNTKIKVIPSAIGLNLTNQKVSPEKPQNS